MELTKQKKKQKLMIKMKEEPLLNSESHKLASKKDRLQSVKPIWFALNWQAIVLKSAEKI